MGKEFDKVITSYRSNEDDPDILHVAKDPWQNPTDVTVDQAGNFNNGEF